MTIVTFVIPVRHPDNARDWNALTSKLRQTMASISNQSHPDWRGIVVANEGAKLPPMPAKFEAVRVGFPPNDLHEFQKAPPDAVRDAFRLDKGRRVLSGMLHAAPTRFFMIVDDDDLVSSEITSHAAAHPDSYGWFVNQGYLWTDGGRWFLKIDDFDRRCGTSLIIRSDLYELPDSLETASEEWMKDMLGSHLRIKPKLGEKGTPLEALPFCGAAYRIGSAGSHSQTPGIWRQKFLNRHALRRPRQLLDNLSRLRPVGPRLRAQFSVMYVSGGH